MPICSSCEQLYHDGLDYCPNCGRTNEAALRRHELRSVGAVGVFIIVGIPFAILGTCALVSVPFTYGVSALGLVAFIPTWLLWKWMKKNL